MKKQLQMLARQIAQLPVPAHSGGYSLAETEAMAIAIVDYVEQFSAEGALARKAFQDIPEGWKEGDPLPEWHVPTREEAIDYILQDGDETLQLYGMTETLRDHYLWAQRYLAEHDTSSVK